MPTTLAELNALSQADFVAALGHLFEHSPWVAEEAWTARPFQSHEQLHRALCDAMHRAPRERQLALIRAHPDLAGRLAQQRQLTAASADEQSAAGLHALTAAELAEFQCINDAYRARHGFPFIICARLNHKDAILAAMRERLPRAPDEEFATALAEIEKIARLRLEAVVVASEPAPD